MAKAQFHRNQKVWVDSVGVWASVEAITPVWAKGFDEPVKITYDVGLGRPFAATELKPEEATDEVAAFGNWRLLRAKNKWQTPGECSHHPYPGTYPVIVTDDADWGGWRTPGAEYDRDPRKIELQALLMSEAPELLQIARELHDFVAETPEDAPEDLHSLARRCAAVLRILTEVPSAPTADIIELKMTG